MRSEVTKELLEATNKNIDLIRSDLIPTPSTRKYRQCERIIVPPALHIRQTTTSLGTLRVALFFATDITYLGAFSIPTARFRAWPLIH